MRLNKQRDLYRDRAAYVRSELLRFSGYLAGPKFSGYDPRDGEPNDYIRTHEVQRWVSQVFLPILNGEFDHELTDIDEKALLGFDNIDDFHKCIMDAREQISID